MSGTPSQYGDFGQRGDPRGKHEGVRRPDERGSWPPEDPLQTDDATTTPPSVPPETHQSPLAGPPLTAAANSPPPPLAVPFGYAPPTSVAPPTHPVLVLGAPGSNGMGIAGFVVSLVGLLACGGILWPVSLGLCIAGMKREPKGLAIAGLVISCVSAMLFFVMFLPLFILPFIVGAAAGVSTSSVLQNTSEQMALDRMILAHVTQTGSLPPTIASLPLSDPSMAIDAWGTPYRLTLDPANAYTIDSAGPDKAFDTPDDLIYQGTAPVANPPASTASPTPEFTSGSGTHTPQDP